MKKSALAALARVMAPVVREYVAKSAADVYARLATAEMRLELRTVEATQALNALADLTKEYALLRERVGVMEVKGLMPGPAGKDGVDGLGFEDLDLVVDDERKGCFLRFTRGEQIKEFRLPTPLDVGVYQPGERYYKGNALTWGGSLWLAKADTMDQKPGEGATAWRLSVKQGREGRAGKDGKP